MLNEPDCEIHLEIIMKNALIRRPVQALLSLTILSIPLAFIFLQDQPWLSGRENLATVLMLGTLSIGLLFFILDQHSLIMISISACALLCVNLKESAQYLHEKIGENSIKIAHLKFSPENPSEQQLFRLILENKVDILSLQDIPLEDIKMIKTKLGRAGYHFSYEVESPDQASGIALFSIYPITYAAGAPYFGNPNIVGKLQLPFQINQSSELYFVSTYIDDDKVYSVQEAALFRKELHYLAGQFNQINAPLIVFGEYNAISLGSEISNFRRHARLIDSRAGFTFPSPMQFLAGGDKVVNHIFYSSELKCISFEPINYFTYPNHGMVGTYEFVVKDTSSNAKQTSQEL